MRGAAGKSRAADDDAAYRRVAEPSCHSSQCHQGREHLQHYLNSGNYCSSTISDGRMNRPTKIKVIELILHILRQHKGGGRRQGVQGSADTTPMICTVVTTLGPSNILFFAGAPLEQHISAPAKV